MTGNQLTADRRPAFKKPVVLHEGRPCLVEEHTIWKGPFCDMQLFVKRNAKGELVGLDDPVYFQVSPTSGHYAPTVVGDVLELTPHANVIVTHWHCASDVPLKDAPKFDLEDYVFGHLLAFLNEFKFPLVMGGYSQSCVTVMAAAAIMAAQNNPHAPLGLILSGGPLNVDAAHSAFRQVSRDLGVRGIEGKFRIVEDGRPGAGREILPGKEQLTALLMAESGRMLMDHVSDVLTTPPYRMMTRILERYTRAKELSVTTDLSADLIRQTIEHVFINASLPKGELVLGSETIRPHKLGAPILAVGGGLDRIVPKEQVFAVAHMCPKAKIDVLNAPSANHFDLKTGRHWRETIAPAYLDFLMAAEAAVSPAHRRARADYLRALIAAGRPVLKSPAPAPAH